VARMSAASHRYLEKTNPKLIKANRCRADPSRTRDQRRLYTLRRKPPNSSNGATGFIPANLGTISIIDRTSSKFDDEEAFAWAAG